SIFIGANRQPQCSDYSSTLNIVAFGSQNLVSLFNPLSPDNVGVFKTLKGHKDEVICLKFLLNSNFLISTSQDSTINIWDNNYNVSLFQTIQNINSNSSIVSLSVLNDRLFVVSDSIGTISLISFNDDKIFQIIKSFKVENEFNEFYPLTLSLHNLYNNDYLLFIGGTNKFIYIFSFQFQDNQIFNLSQNLKLPGHEDWIKCLSFKKIPNSNTYLLASGSQDRYIRLWNLKLTGNSIQKDKTILDNQESTQKLSLLTNKTYYFKTSEESLATYSIHFEALIIGHDDWISSLTWNPNPNILQLFSTSADTSLILWESDEDSGVWYSKAILGELSIKGASTATGSSGGFWSSLWIQSTEKQLILSHGKTGSWRSWSNDYKNDSNWIPQLSLTGCIKPITDLSWSKFDNYILSTSLDQTTRLFAKWNKHNTWHEFARPQIHGYDMVCINSIDSDRFISAGDEKILRSFVKPNSIKRLLNCFSSNSNSNSNSNFNHTNQINQNNRYENVSLPTLGLSNKIESNNDNIGSNALANLTTPPLEDHLQRFTLWAEVEKLYGHGFEISSCDVSNNNNFLVSSCKSNSVKHAQLRIFRYFNDSWRKITTGPDLIYHSLTVTSCKFSPDDLFILAVSRDRKFSIWEFNVENENYILKYKNERAHTRILWDCCWIPNLKFGYKFITVSRDKSFKFWNLDIEKGSYSLISTSKLPNGGITSVDIYNELINEKFALAAFGLDNGSIYIYSFDLSSNDSKNFKLVEKLDDGIAPDDKISAIRWKMVNNELVLAVGSSDNSIRIFNFDIKEV
ncbi:Elongator subunit ELP2, partial [Ascoidea rubescens DSM 1968]